MPIFGEIARKTRDLIPVTWAALAKTGDSGSALGEDGIQERIDQAKYEVFRSVIDPDDELTTYGPIGCEYVAVVSALKLVMPGYDHWMAAATSWGTSSGQNNNKTFVDRAAALLKFRDEVLLPEEARLYAMVVDLIPDIIVTKKSSVMLARDADPDALKTMDPFVFDDAFERPRTAA